MRMASKDRGRDWVSMGNEGRVPAKTRVRGGRVAPQGVPRLPGWG